MATTSKKSGSKKSKRNVPNGVVHIQSTFNNTIVSITDTSGEVISWSSAGASGFKGARKGTPFAAQTAADLIGVSAAFIFEVYCTLFRKNYDFWSSPVEKRSPSTIWGFKICCRFLILKIWHQKRFLIFQVCG